jgi:L-ascorbate metabolism protein UlaG (beta-lactamase superfamily)
MSELNSKIYSYTSNPALETIWKDWKGTPLNQNGDFINHHQPMQSELRDVLKWQLSTNPDKAAKKADTFALEVIDANAFIESQVNGLVWLGHATYLLRLEGVLILIDPVFSSPSLMIKRLSRLPIDTQKLYSLDLILLSHDHRDHADEASIKQMARQNPNVVYLTGLKVDGLLKKWTGSKNIQAAGWYQRFETKFPLQITYMPSRHWGKRLLNDTNKRLWGGFMIHSASKTIYFAGDSGYGPHFKEIAEVFPAIDIAMLGIGAFKPEWFMGPSHTSPKDAHRAFQDLNAKTMLPMHYGTFDLADEPLGEPFRRISEIKNQSQDDIRLLKIGEVLKFE